jgi:putative FmdB family regulatory protein
MPLYDFRCEDCDEVFEVNASFAELAQLSVCPQCGGSQVSRRYGAVLLGGKRTSVKPENFVRPHGPVTPQGPAKPRKP